MNFEPLVSVIMNAHNAEKYLLDALDSVFCQTYKNWEIIFYDNMSSDSTLAILRDIKDPRLRYYKSDTFLPLGAARNNAIKNSHGELIAFLDCDDKWLPHKLELQVPLFKNQNIGIVYSDTIFFNDNGRERLLYNGKLPCMGYCFRQLLSGYFLSMETVMLRRAALESEPIWFDERFNMIEEADLFRRISRNWDVSAINRPLAKWRVHNGSWTQKFPFLFREETKLMLENYLRDDCEFLNKYSNEIKNLMYGIDMHEAKYYWLSGNKWPLIKCLIKSRKMKKYFLAILVFLWPASYSNIALFLKGEVLSSN